MKFSTLLLLLLAFTFLPTAANAFVIVNPVPATETASSEEDALAAAAEYKESLKNMSAKERRQLRKAQKKQIKQVLADQKDGKSDLDDGDILLIILAILLPPLAVFLHQGEINTKFWISLVLTLLFFLPGIIYALLVITGSAKK